MECLNSSTEKKKGKKLENAGVELKTRVGGAATCAIYTKGGGALLM